MVRSSLALKYAIYLNGPCVGALPVYNTYINKFWDEYRGEYQGGHAIAIIGWDDDGFIIRNSWGTSYGEKGYATIPYKVRPRRTGPPFRQQGGHGRGV